MKKYLSVLFALVLVVSLAIVAAPATWVEAQGTTINVPADNATILIALQTANPGDTILVAANLTDNYTQNLPVSTANLTIQGAGATNTTVQAADPDHPVFNVTASGVTIKNFTIYGATNAPGVRLAAGSCKVDSCNVTGNQIGIKIEGRWGEGTENRIRRNTITGNTIGIRLPGTRGWNQVWYNNIVDNTNYGVYAEPVPSDPHYRQWAGFNYWGDADGPGGVGLVTTGDSVNENVWYNPWLNQPFSTILASGIADVSMGIPLKVGWNTVATPLPLAGGSNQWNQIVARSNLGTHVTSIYDKDTGFVGLDDGDTRVFSPLDAVFIKMASDGIVSFKISTATYAPPTRDLKQGWNLIGASMAMTNQELEMWQVLKSVDQTSGGLVGYNMVVSPPLATQPSWVYVRGQETAEEDYEWQNMKMCRGYWIYMENADEMAGFGSTPITAKIWD